MSLRAAVAAPFRQRGREQIGESEFIVALSLDRDWFSPDQAAKVVDTAIERGLLSRHGDDLVAEFEPESVDVPPGFAPDDSVFRDRSPFDAVLEVLVEDGADKHDAVAGINRLQADLEVTVEAAAVLYAKRRGHDVAGIAADARRALVGD